MQIRDFRQYPFKWCQFGLTPQSLYNQYLWCHYRNECIALYTSTCPRNINFKYMLICLVDATDSMQGTLDPMSPKPCVLPLLSSEFCSISSCCIQYFKLLLHIRHFKLVHRLSWSQPLWRDCERNTDLTSQGLFCCLQSSNFNILWFVSLFRRNLDEVEQCCYQ